MDKPIKQIRAGAISASVWLNSKDVDGTRVEFKTATFSRSWRDKDSGEWRHERINLRKTDVPKCLVVLNELQKELWLSVEKEDEK